MSLFVDFVGLNTLVSSSFETDVFDNIITSNLANSAPAVATIVYTGTSAVNDTITVSDGYLGGGVGPITFTAVSGTPAANEWLRQGADADNFSRMCTAINNYPGLNLNASNDAGTKTITITNLFNGSDGNGSITYGVGTPPFSSNTGFVGGAGILESQKLPAINLHRNGPYNFATFKQIRIHENPLTRYQRKNNLLSFSKRSEQKEITDSNNNVLFIQEKFGDLVTFTEPAVVSSYHPLVYNLGTLQGDKVKSFNRFGLSFDYGNHITYFTNEELNKLLLLDDLDDEVYEQIKELYLNGALETNASEVDYFEFLRYKQDIYPREINKYSAAVRQRTNYQNDFWRDARADRNRTKNLGFGYSRNTSMWNLDAETDWTTRSNIEIGSSPTSTAEGILQNKFCHFTDDIAPTTGLKVAPIYNRRHTLETTSSVVSPSGIDIPETGSGAAADVGAIFQGDALWEAGEQAGKNPFYSSYDYFVEELRGLGKDYSIVPEFRISDHVETLLKQGNLTKLTNMFEVTGAQESSDVSNETGFYETYSTSDFLKHFASIKEDHKDFEDPATITLTCKALKKFLAYDSFYPQDRSVDCVEQFYSSYEKYISYPSVVGNSIQPYLDTMFAPGVLYNTIKSGIAVDYPIVETGATVYSPDPGEEASGSFVYSTSIVPTDGDYITISDGGLNSGIGAKTFIFRTTAIFSYEVEIDPSSNDTTYQRLKNAIVWSSGLNIWADINTTTDTVSFINLFPGTAGNVAISYSLADANMIPSATRLGMDGGAAGVGNYMISNGAFTKRIPFEALVEPEKYLGETSIGTNTVHPLGSFATTSSWDGKGDNLYTKMMSNYLAEIPEFFLQGSQLSTIASEEQGSDNFGVAEFGKTYAMRLKIFKTMDQNNTLTPRVDTETHYGGYIPPQSTIGSETITMYSRPTAFGPPGAAYSSPDPAVYYDSRNGINPGFTPPYYDGEAWIDFVWRAPQAGTAGLTAGLQTRKFSLSEILSNVTASSIRFSPVTLANTVASTNKGPYSTTNPVGDLYLNQRFLGSDSQEYFEFINKPINANSNNLHSSVNCLESGRIISRDAENNTLLNENIQQTIDANKGATNARWVIQTKFETPILNFKDVSLTTASVNLHSAQTPRGMWHQYGVIPENNEGIYLQIQNIPNNWLRWKNGTTEDTSYYETGSLADICGFPTNPVKLGQVAQGRVISEAVVAVPYINHGGVKKFFEINENNFNAAKKYFQSVSIVNNGGNPDNLGLGNPELWEERAGSSVIDQVRKMKSYVFPPTMDFFNYPEVTPFSMYIFEFRHTLSQQDLADMWQGLPPEIGTSFEVAEDSISHPLLANQLLGSGEGTDRSRTGADLEGEIRWMVFKVKKRAKTNYFDKVVGKKAGYGQAATAAGFSTNASSETAQEEFISYNWPYDFFSLVELVKIDAEIEFANIPEGKFEPKQREIPEAVQQFAANLSRRRR